MKKFEMVTSCSQCGQDFLGRGYATKNMETGEEFPFCSYECMQLHRADGDLENLCEECGSVLEDGVCPYCEEEEDEFLFCECCDTEIEDGEGIRHQEENGNVVFFCSELCKKSYYADLDATCAHCGTALDDNLMCPFCAAERLQEELDRRRENKLLLDLEEAKQEFMNRR